MGMESRYVWMDGGLVDYANANIHFMTSGLHYGIAVFEGIRSYNTTRGPAVFRLKEHTDRLVDSAHVLGFRDLPYSADDIQKAILQTVAANGYAECYIRPVIWLGNGGWNLNVDTGTPHMGISVWEWTAYLGEEALDNGVRANISSYTRHHPNVMMTKAKISGNYANSVLAKTESVRLGFDEAILMDPQGYVAECTGENIFIVRSGKLYTPPTSTILEGITRRCAMQLAADLGYVVQEQMLSREALYIADELFFTGTAAEVTPIRELDGRIIGEGKAGPITKKIQKAFFDVVTGKDKKHRKWLTPVKSM